MFIKALFLINGLDSWYGMLYKSKILCTQSYIVYVSTLDHIEIVYFSTLDHIEIVYFSTLDHIEIVYFSTLDHMRLFISVH